jgi:hypothetical protein
MLPRESRPIAIARRLRPDIEDRVESEPTWDAGAAVRPLHEKRDPALERDPGFQRLLEIDSARKSALLYGNEQDLKAAQLQLLAGDRVPRNVLERALVDPNMEVRLAALYEIGLGMEEPPLDLLGPVLLGDPSPEVRLEALEIVAEAAAADALIHRALDDADAAVRNEAHDLIEERIENLE